MEPKDREKAQEAVDALEAQTQAADVFSSLPGDSGIDAEKVIEHLRSSLAEGEAIIEATVRTSFLARWVKKVRK